MYLSSLTAVYLTANGENYRPHPCKVICTSWSDAMNTRHIFTTVHRGIMVVLLAIVYVCFQPVTSWLINFAVNK